MPAAIRILSWHLLYKNMKTEIYRSIVLSVYMGVNFGPSW